MNALLTMLIPILVLMGGILATTVFVFLKSDARALTKFLLVPAAFVAAIAVPVAFVTMMGYSVSLKLPEEFTVLAHHVIIADSKKKSIEIWANNKERTRLYVLPYSKALEKQLAEAQAGRRQGLQARMKKKGKGGFDADSSEFQMDLLSPEQISPKDPLPESPPEAPAAAPEFDKSSKDAT